MKRAISTIALGLFACTASADVPPQDNLVVDSGAVLARADALPYDGFEDTGDVYLEGYIQALIDMHFCEYTVIVVVKDHVVYLSQLPKNALIANSILTFVQDLQDVKKVVIKEDMTKEELEMRGKYVREKPHVNGIWFPQTTVLFQPLIADPRQPTNSVAYRFGDQVVGQQAAAVSIGDDFPIFRWCDVWPAHGDLQIGIEAGIWAVFNYYHIHNRLHDDGTCELINTDYFVGIPIDYAFDRWSFRFRGYHISSHLGDEFLVNHPKELDKRRNPSMEAIDLVTAYQFSRNLRVYFGPGVVVHSDKTFKIKPMYVEYGAEIRLLGKKFFYQRVFGTPFFAVHLNNWQQHDWDIDTTYMLGYEVSKLSGIGRKMRLFVEYHQGFSWEGQFFNKRTKYGELGFAWDF